MKRREIKFRAWVISEKKMISDMLSFHECGGISWDNSFNHDRENKQAYIWGTNDLHLMQFTGLCDKNGAEIYEGDIIICGTPHTEKIVSFENGRFGTRTDGGFYTLNGWVTGGRSVEVVGNIHK